MELAGRGIYLAVIKRNGRQLWKILIRSSINAKTDPRPRFRFPKFRDARAECIVPQGVCVRGRAMSLPRIVSRAPMDRPPATGESPPSLSLPLPLLRRDARKRGSARRAKNAGMPLAGELAEDPPLLPHPPSFPLIDVREGERSPGPKPAEATWNPRDRSSTATYGTSRKWSAGHISLLNPLMRVPNGNLHRFHSYVRRVARSGEGGGLSLRQAGIQVLLIPRTLPVTPRR